jgi:hypothetical protein
MDIVKAMSSRAQRSRKQSAGSGEAEPAVGRAGGSRRRGRAVVKALLLGGVVALATKPEVRNRLLDALFGPEEQFDYESLTEPVAPPIAADPPASAAIPEPDAGDFDATPAEDSWYRPEEAPQAAGAEPDEAPPATPSEPPAPMYQRWARGEGEPASNPDADGASAPAEYELWLAGNEEDAGGDEQEQAPLEAAPDSSAQGEGAERDEARRDHEVDEPGIGEADSPRNGWWVPRHRRTESTPEGPGRD